MKDNLFSALAHLGTTPFQSHDSQGCRSLDRKDLSPAAYREQGQTERKYSRPVHEVPLIDHLTGQMTAFCSSL